MKHLSKGGDSAERKPELLADKQADILNVINHKKLNILKSYYDNK
jgi:hypothetical protein